ncbi:hypothetical protein ACFU7Y_05185 [Kitasatospora sp. NPDC057542]|uniref:hypothetical protein n=1 Tax=Kitasatospora sp. NPDC057542 TaxID=3346162 RepID=UPI0036B8B29A
MADELEERSVALVDQGALESLDVVAEHLLCPVHPLGLCLDGGALAGVEARTHGQAALAGLCGDGGQGFGERVGCVGARLGMDGDLLGGEPAAGQGMTAEDHLGVRGEVAVDEHAGVGVDGDMGEADPVRRHLGWLVASAQNQQVGDHFGAGGLAVSSGRQADRAHQVGSVGDLQTRGLAGAVEGVAAGEHRDQPARSHQVERFDDEVVVGGQAQRVVVGVVERDLVEGDVAHGAVVVAVGHPGVDEGFGADLGVRVEGGGDLGGDRVELDSGHVDAFGRECDEIATAAAGFRETELLVA